MSNIPRDHKTDEGLKLTPEQVKDLNLSQLERAGDKFLHAIEGEDLAIPIYDDIRDLGIQRGTPSQDSFIKAPKIRTPEQAGIDAAYKLDQEMAAEAEARKIAREQAKKARVRETNMQRLKYAGVALALAGTLVVGINIAGHVNHNQNIQAAATASATQMAPLNEMIEASKTEDYFDQTQKLVEVQDMTREALQTGNEDLLITIADQFGIMPSHLKALLNRLPIMSEIPATDQIAVTARMSINRSMNPPHTALQSGMANRHGVDLNANHSLNSNDLAIMIIYAEIADFNNYTSFTTEIGHDFVEPKAPVPVGPEGVDRSARARYILANELNDAQFLRELREKLSDVIEISNQR